MEDDARNLFEVRLRDDYHQLLVQIALQPLMHDGGLLARMIQGFPGQPPQNPGAFPRPNQPSAFSAVRAPTQQVPQPFPPQQPLQDGAPATSNVAQKDLRYNQAAPAANGGLPSQQGPGPQNVPQGAPQQPGFPGSAFQPTNGVPQAAAYQQGGFPQGGQPAQGGFPQPGQQPGFPQADPRFPSGQPPQGSFPQPGQAPQGGFPQPGQQPSGFPQQPGFPQPGQQQQRAGFPQPPQQPGQPQPNQQQGFPQPGQQQPGFPPVPQQPGLNAGPQQLQQQPGFPQPGPPQPGYSQPGQQQPGFPGQQPGFPPQSAPQQPQGFPPLPGQQPQGGFQQPGFPPVGQPGQQPGFGGYPQGQGVNPGFPGQADPWGQQPGAFPGMPGPPGGFGAQPPRRLDPSMLPSAVQVIEDDRQTRSGIFPTGYPFAEYPPLTTTDFYAQDMGNANPKFMRSTLYAVPTTQEYIKNTSLPFSLSLTPFAKTTSNEYPVPVVDLGELGPVRCHRCKAYICPFMEFVDGGRKFRCAFCHTATTVEETYFAHLDHTGRRTDLQHRPELYLGSYEFVATKLYCKNGIPPKQPAFIFFLDVSYNAIRTGLVDIFCKNIPQLLKNLPKDHNQEKSSMKIGFATYDQTIHFYNLGNPHKPEMLIANDVEDVFVPIIDGFLVDYNDAEAALIATLEQVRLCFADTRITDTMLGPVIQAGLDAFRNADCAGKMFIFHTSLPSFEAPGRLKNREDRKVLGSDKEKVQLNPGTEFYSKLGEECIKVGAAVDLFLFPNSNVDVASIAPVCHTSGGNIYKYQYFDAERDGVRFISDLQHDISRQVVFDAMMRVRTSTGVRPTGFYGAFYMQNTTDIEVGAIDADTGMVVEIKYDDKLDEKASVVFQAATLFTSVGGQRRLRIHNISLPVTADYNQIFRLSDQDAIVNHLFKVAAKTIKEKTPKEMKDEIISRSAQILASYREKCSQQSPLSQLVLPEGLKLLPLYMSCVLRSDALSGGSEMTVDDRVWQLNMIPRQRISLAMRFLYPQVLPITNLEVPESAEQFQVPIPVRASYDFLNPSEVYLIENGLMGFIWVGNDAPVPFLNDVFNVQSIQHLDTESHNIPERDNARSRAVRRLIDEINADRPLRLKIFVIKQQDSLESWMKKFLVEDKYASNTVSYADFLCQVHREIRTLLS
uniref:Zf-Sec23_Sec24 domain-containing protein n=1 Tax=Panagrellus redivivus TaxID=6233 RepID=A0A7E4W055_PANRE